VQRFLTQSLAAKLCQVCQCRLCSPNLMNPTKLSIRSLEHEGERYHFCSEWLCRHFKYEPDKYIQACLPVHQIYQGNCEGADVERS